MSHHRRDLFFDWSTNVQPKSRAEQVIVKRNKILAFVNHGEIAGLAG
jgi:hypothetical protein